jgi:uncharacterized protein YcbK (DUF882 family)|tara:strand:- start:144 stop:524 length:381 start_codon:yes stop_codon:yes gene_type:complete
MLQYFNFEEFDCPTLDGSGLPTSDGGKMCIDFLHKLDSARDIAGIPFKINSAYRQPAHNLNVGGRVGSSHVKVPCKAVDIHCNNSADRSKILNALFKVGLGRRVGIAKTFIHVDNDTDKGNAIWLY